MDFSQVSVKFDLHLTVTIQPHKFSFLLSVTVGHGTRHGHKKESEPYWESGIVNVHTHDIMYQLIGGIHFGPLPRCNQNNITYLIDGLRRFGGVLCDQAPGRLVIGFSVRL